MLSHKIAIPQAMHLLFQLSSNQFLALSLWNLTETMVFHIGHPGDEILGLYGQGAYRNPKSTRISPERKYTEVDLQIRASKQEWGLLTTKKGMFSFLNIVQDLTFLFIVRLLC